MKTWIVKYHDTNATRPWERYGLVEVKAHDEHHAAVKFAMPRKRGVDSHWKPGKYPIAVWEKEHGSENKKSKGGSPFLATARI